MITITLVLKEIGESVQVERTIEATNPTKYEQKLKLIFIEDMRRLHVNMHQHARTAASRIWNDAKYVILGLVLGFMFMRTILSYVQ